MKIFFAIAVRVFCFVSFFIFSANLLIAREIYEVGIFTDKIYDHTLNLTDSVSKIRDDDSSSLPLLTDSLKQNIPAVSEIINNTVRLGSRQIKLLKKVRYHAYSKTVLRAGLITGIDELMNIQDTSEHKILGLSENEENVTLSNDGKRDQKVISRRVTSSLKKIIPNVLVLNIYDERVDLGVVTVPSPLSAKYIRYYDYRLDGIEYEKGKRVFRIKTDFKSGIFPGFKGYLYINDSIFTLRKINLQTNSATNLFILNTIRFVQNYEVYNDSSGLSFVMPTGMVVKAYGSFMELIRFSIINKTVISDYKFNQPVAKGVFDDFDVEINKDADKPQSKYWEKWDYLKTPEEKEEFEKLSIVNQQKPGFISFGGSTINFGRNLSLNILDAYRFTRAEGHVPALSFTYDLYFKKYVFNAMMGYGSADYMLKYNLNTDLNLTKNRSVKLSAGVYYNTLPLHKSPNVFIYLMNDIYTLFTHKDKMNYYNASGFYAELGKSFLTSKFTATLKYSQEEQKNAYVNTQFSFYRKDAVYADNPPVNEGLLRNIGIRLRIDLNRYKYTDWGDNDISIRKATFFPVILFDFDYSGRKLGSSFEFKRYNLSLAGYSNIFSYLNLNYKIGTVYLLGSVPYQMLASLEQKFFGYPKDLSFIVVDYGEFFGDVAYWMNVENNFGKFFPFNVPVLRKLTFLGFFGAGYTSVRQQTRDYSSVKDFGVTKGWYTEIGFGIANLMDVGYLRMGFRLSNFVNNNNTFLSFDMGL
ncbi:MAG: DUF5686 family protein [Ignavibacteriae bacterium]|nr:DUF5686 family protein [Ignavibacteriota bacterium]